MELENKTIKERFVEKSDEYTGSITVLNGKVTTIYYSPKGQYGFLPDTEAFTIHVNENTIHFLKQAIKFIDDHASKRNKKSF